MKLLGTLVLGAMTIAPMMSLPPSAQAAPLRDKWENRDYRTLSGVVVDDVKGRDFVIRTNNGDRVRVRLDEREPRRLSAGDEVRVSGHYDRSDRDTFHADRVEIVDNRNRYNSQSFTGRVTDVDSDRRFDIKVNDKEYNVYTRDRLPRQLNRGDYVRVYGDRVGDNGIRNATVALLDNNDGDYKSFTGQVTDVDSRQKFDIVANGKKYNVYTRNDVPRHLNRGDYVKVYGVRTGDNGIRNATVTILDSNSESVTWIGRVTDVDSNSRFDFEANGNSYDVFTRNSLPSRLNRGDYVRVSGRRDGKNNIVDASVVVLVNRH
jgi:hypothetical protein